MGGRQGASSKVIVSSEVGRSTWIDSSALTTHT